MDPLVVIEDLLGGNTKLSTLETTRKTYQRGIYKTRVQCGYDEVRPQDYQGHIY